MGALSAEKCASPILIIAQSEDISSGRLSCPRAKELLHTLGSIRYCKAERFSDCVAGALRIPSKSGSREAQLSFGFSLTEETLILISDTGDLRRAAEKLTERSACSISPDGLLLDMLEYLTEGDLMYLFHIEKKLDELEEELPRGEGKKLPASLTVYRKKLSEYNAYYEQLCAVADVMQSRAGRDDASFERWDRFAARMGRLQGHVRLLRENAVQLRELFQSYQDARQNKVMCILTVVTTLFLPLTLLTGWYGMNFTGMPELSWRYGYLSVIIAAVIIVAAEIIYFKKKKFF